MKRNALAAYTMLKVLAYIILLCYFGFIINPQWAASRTASPLDFHWYD